MVLNQGIDDLLYECFTAQGDARIRADTKLSTAADNPNHGLDVLRFVAKPSVKEQIREAAAVHFRDYLKARWVSSSLTPISDGEKEKITTLIVTVILSATPKIEAPLREALSVIGNHDFSGLWLAFVPEIKSTLEKSIIANDFASVKRYLSFVDDLVEVRGNNQLYSDNFPALLFNTADSISKAINGWFGARFCRLIEAQRICFRILCLVLSLELPSVFSKEIANKWMYELKNHLTGSYITITDDDADRRSKAAVSESILSGMEKGEQAFQKYLKEFVEAVQDLLVIVSASQSCEQLTLTAIKFLTIVSIGDYHNLFASDEILEKVTKSIVIPNVMLWNEDEELFKKNYVEFIRRDMEGSNFDTRRRIACELLKGIAVNYKEKISERVSEQIRKCLELYAEDPAVNWRYKEHAVYLNMSFATKRGGCGTLLTNNDVYSFFRSFIVPELQETDLNALPILKAAALKFFTMFLDLIPKTVALTFFGDVVRFIGSSYNVVHSYAANCIEKVLLNGVHSEARFTSMDIGPILPVLIANLFDALKQPGSEDNTCIMRCIMRVFQTADVSSEEVAFSCITELQKVLTSVRKNPERNKVFNYLFFESLVTILQRSCEKNHLLLQAFEKQIYLRLKLMFATDATILSPYVIQVVAQFVDLKGSTLLPIGYTDVFDTMLRPGLWEKSANVPALVRLFRSILQVAPNLLPNKEKLKPVVVIVEKLLSSPSTVEDGLHMLNSVIVNLSHDIFAEHLNGIWASLYSQFRSSETQNACFVRGLIILMSLLLVKHGSRKLMDIVNSVPMCTIHTFLDELWIPGMKTIIAHADVKLISVASSKLLCESPTFADNAADELLGKLLDGTLTLLSWPLPQEERVGEDELEVPDLGVDQATFVCLNNATKEKDFLKDLEDPKEFSMALLARVSPELCRRFRWVISNYVSPTNKAVLLHFAKKK
ncbi:hypothetical protein L2E82_41554 [Cichorium intybus]|uniref:Uncharacterized protein n=1 Tax=Cichorium intybus TaxID=13427 RepID=A0ACB9AMR3_CICIN|nr:hypothetical protein L2E82_41554 [Cichorium intybus]